MNKILLSLFLVVSMSIQARKVTNPKDLQANDTFSMRITVPTGDIKSNSVWNFEEGYKIDIDFHVLSVNKDSIQIAVKPTRTVACFQNPAIQNSFAYFDSNYYNYYDNKSLFYLFEDNSVIASINIKDRGVSMNYINNIDEEKSTDRWRKEWYIQTINTPKGLIILKDYNPPTTDGYLDFDLVIKLSLSGFIKEWNEKFKNGASMPWLINLEKQEVNAPTFVQIVSASFDLEPNTSIIFEAPKEMHQDKVFIKIGDQKIKPTKKEGNNYSFNLYLSSPKRIYLNDLILDLTPADSLVVSFYAPIHDFQIRGKGAENSIYTNTIRQLYDGKVLNIEDDESIKFMSAYNIANAFTSNLKNSELFFKSTLQQYVHGMNDYWIKSAELSFDYWYINKRIKPFGNILETNETSIYRIRESLKDNPKELKELNKLYDEIQIPWLNQHFTNIFPFGDYLYQPYTYNNFVNYFFLYKAKEASNTVITGMKSLDEHIGSYYFADAIFWGYPQSYLTSETLKYLMVNFQLNESNREYEDFLKKLHDLEIRKSVIALHDQLLKVEPGANIKELNLEVEKYIPLNNKEEKYIILLVGDSLGFNYISNNYTENVKSIYESLKSEIDKENLTDKIDISIITSESSKSILNESPEIQNKIIFVSDEMLKDYEDKVVIRKGAFIISNSDGVIIKRDLNSSNDASPYFIIKAIKEDIETKNNQESGSNRIFIIIVTILISVLITFFVVRYIVMRRERIKRHIQELELKAIRAQMNPHFIFNALGSIQNLISQKKENEANKYLVDFSKLLRMVLSSSEKKLISLSDEISMLNLYLHLEQLRVPFNYNIHVDNNIDTQIEEIPGMLIQPILENAVKHGITPKGEGQITLNFSLKNHIIYVVVTDSGNGYMFETDKQTTGFGLKSVRERLTLINKELHLDISLQIENKVENDIVKGCKVTLMIPV